MNDIDRRGADGRRHPDRAGPTGSGTSARRSPSWRAAELAEAEGHHPDIGFGRGRATVWLRTKKIKGLHENDFIRAMKLDRLSTGAAATGQEG